MINHRSSDMFGYGLEGLYKSKPNRCFECGVLTMGKHHVVPIALGGTRQLPLCQDCHSIVHGDKPNTVFRSDLIKVGLASRRKNGHRLGAPIKVTKELIDRCGEMRILKMSIAKIAKATGLSVGSVHNIVKRL